MIDKDAFVLIADPQHPLCNGYERVQRKAKISKEHHACYDVVGNGIYSTATYLLASTWPHKYNMEGKL